MSEHAHPRLTALVRTIPATASVVVGACALLTLVGWLIDFELFKSLLHSRRIAMNPLSAVCFAFAAIAVWILRSPHRSRAAMVFAYVCSTVVSGIGVLRLLAYLTGREMGMDELIFPTRVGENLMSPNSALCCALLGVAMLTLDRRTRRGIHPAQFIIIAIGCIASLALIGYLFGVRSLTGISHFKPMSLNSAICFLLVAVALLCARPQRQPLAMLLDDTVGGSVARRLLPAAFLLPILLGYFRLVGERRGWFSADFGLTLVVLGLIILFNLLIWWNAQIQRKVDRRRRLAETALRQSETRSRLIIETANDAFVAMDSDGSILAWNPQAVTTFGWTHDEAMGKAVADLIIPQRFREAHWEGLRNYLSTGDGPVLGKRVELSALHRDGTEFPIEITISPGREGTTRIFFAFVHDITARKRAEEERDRFFTLSTDMVAVAGFDGYFKRVNRAFEATLGYTCDEILAHPWLHFVHPDDIAPTIAEGEKLAQGALVLRFQNRYRCKDGTYRWLSWMSVPVVKEGLIYAIGHDMTELKQAQSALVQTEKLAGLGQMVAGVAHEINNPLAFVSNNVAVLQRDLRGMSDLLKLYGEADPAIASSNAQLSEKIRELSERMDLAYTTSNLDQIITRSRDGLKRIQQIVKDLREFARLDSGDLQEADLNAGIESTINIIRGVAKKKQVTLETALQPLPPVKCYPAKINQVVMNLISNAIDACHENGHVTVKSSRNGDSVRIEVIDTGKGIDPALQEKIFDPFFTTKKIGEGTGLGLSISYGIIKDHGGTIDVESEVGRGSRFVVALPIRASN